jgi:hypothetical protein
MAERPSSKIEGKMKQNRIIAGFIFVMLLALIVACGGGGGTPGTTATTATTGIVGPVTGVRLEAVTEGTSTVVDPTNIFVGEVVRFRVTGLDQGQAGSPRVVLPGTTFSLSGNPGGTLQSTGVFTASGTPTGSFGQVSTSYSGTSYTASVRVVSPQAIVQGTGIINTGQIPAGVQIQALDVSGTVVATGLVSANGNIRLSAPTSAVRLTVNFALVDPSASYYYRQFKYNSKDYSTLIPDCTAVLPTLTVGTTSNLASQILFYASSSSTPPPITDGCS